MQTQGQTLTSQRKAPARNQTQDLLVYVLTTTPSMNPYSPLKYQCIHPYSSVTTGLNYIMAECLGLSGLHLQ